MTKKQKFYKKRGCIKYFLDLLWLKLFRIQCKMLLVKGNSLVTYPFVMFIELETEEILYDLGRKGVVEAVKCWPDRFKMRLDNALNELAANAGVSKVEDLIIKKEQFEQEFFYD
jgi:hypothetical protein